VLRPLLCAAALSVLLVASACGGGGDSAPEPEAAPPPAATAPPATTAAEVPPAPTPETGAAPWPAPPNPLELTVEAGLEPEVNESLIHHVHAHLDVFVNGEPIQVPAGIGINIEDPGVQHGQLSDGTAAYGGIERCDQPCISPLHTHDTTGILHTESPFRTNNTLGQFFTEWGVQLDDQCVGGYCKPDAAIAVYIDGEPYEDNPADIQLTDLEEIAIVIGTPPAVIPGTADFSVA
jgi:hypothetical protein